jgi:hypothetical protein
MKWPCVPDGENLQNWGREIEREGNKCVAKWTIQKDNLLFVECHTEKWKIIIVFKLFSPSTSF